MYCPFCNHRDSRVIESRLTAENSSVRRRRACDSCQRRFTTYERIETVQLSIVKSSGASQPYNREKLQAGITRACAKTLVSSQQIDDLVDTLESQLMSSGQREISSRMMGDLVVSHLLALNEVAYVRFASVYKQFQSIDDFIVELRSLRVATGQ